MNWKWRVAFGIMAIVVLVSIIYAFVQTVEAQVVVQEVQNQKELIDRLTMERDASSMEASRQNKLYAECQKELILCRTK